MLTRTKTHNKALQSEAPRLSGRAGVTLGYPSPTATHLSRPSSDFFLTDDAYRLAERAGMASQAAVLPAGVTNGSPAVSAPTNSYGGELGAV